MAKYLVIVESPAKAKTIEKFLGRNYKVMASIGHIRDLPKSKMGVDIEENFEPRYINIRGKGPLIKDLKKAAKKAERVFLATDPDREGEAISWHLMHILSIPLDEVCRVTFHEITKSAIKEAIKHPRQIDQQLVDAQQARRVLDRLVGYSISPILWRKIRKGLSAGRVQSVATKLVIDREREIEAFNPEEYWKIFADVDKGTKAPITFEGVKVDGEKLSLGNKEEADVVIDTVKNNPLAVTEIKERVKRRNPGLCFTTSALQQEASNRINFSPKKTMIVAQQLYEGIQVKGHGTVGLITYMRTDSTRISNEAKAEVSEYIKEQFGDDYLGGAPKKAKASKNAQDAHEAIRPTSTLRHPDEIKASLSKDQYKLYKLIWERFVAAHMAPAQFNGVTIDATAGNVIMRVTGSQLKFDGFIKVYSYASSKDRILPTFEEGEVLNVNEVKGEQSFTQPPARYTEASLVKEMEDKGIGRPSTYAPTISTILSRGYVEREKKMLMPTELGFIIADIMRDYFSKVVNVSFTADLEERFDRIEMGEEAWKLMISDFYKDFHPLLEHADQALEKLDLVEETDIDCEKCGHKMVIKHGRFGKFLACSNYPECDNTKPILKKIGISCPLCEKGDVVERKTKKLKNFYGCSEFPDCRFVSWDKPIGKPCPTCGQPLVEKKTKKIHEIRCSDKECGYKEKIEQDN